MERQLYVDLAETSVEAFNAASKTIKCLQIANGALYTENQHYECIHDEKISALQQIIAEASGMPILVAYHFQSDRMRLLKAFPQAKALDQNPQTLTDWNHGKIPLLLAHPASCGHGLNLQYGSNILVFFSQWWNLEAYQQMCERIGPTRQQQAGLDRPVYLYHLIARNTLDELVLQRLQFKRELQDLLLEAMRRKEERCVNVS